MAALDELIAKIPDGELRTRIAQEVGRLKSSKRFGLVYECHGSECTPLYQVPVGPGRRVARNQGPIKQTFFMEALTPAGQAICRDAHSKEQEQIPLKELVCVAEFGEAIFPSLEQLYTLAKAPRVPSGIRS